MYYGKKKGIIIIIIIILLLLMVAGGILAYLYTDLFKSNETLFLKYIDQTAKSLKYTENTQMQDVAKLQKQVPYKIQGELNFAYEGEDNSNLEMLKNMKLKIDSNVDKKAEKSYTKATAIYQNQDLFELEYANSNNIYALKSSEIVTAFVGIRNENLKSLAQQLGITPTDQIPDRIPFLSYEELFNLSQEEKQHIIDTYLPVIIENIPKNNYSKQTNMPITKEGVEYNTTPYRLDLNAEEIDNIIVKLLETLKQDSITLNTITTKAKLLNLSSEYTEINNLTQVIQKLIDNRNNTTEVLQDGISIIVYTEKGQTVLTEVIIKNQIKLTIYGENKQQNNHTYMMIENLSASDNFTTLEIEITTTKTDTQSNYQVLMNKDNTIGVEIYIDNSGSIGNSSVASNYQVVYNEENNKLIIDYKQDMTLEDVEEQIIELNNTNCAILNDYPADQLAILITAITQQTNFVLNQKMQQIGWKF